MISGSTLHADSAALATWGAMTAAAAIAAVLGLCKTADGFLPSWWSSSRPPPKTRAGPAFRLCSGRSEKTTKGAHR